MRRIRNWRVVVAILVCWLVVMVGWRIYASRVYTASVEADYTPLSSTALLDGHRVRVGTHKVRPGKHSLVVSKEGFLTQTSSVSVKKGENGYIGIVLEPTTPKTANWYKEHSEDQRSAERISGKLTDMNASKALSLEPFIKELPFIGPGFSYQIGVGAISNGRPTIVIHAQSDEALADAKQWIRSMGYDPDKMQIIVNPDGELDAN